MYVYMCMCMCMCNVYVCNIICNNINSSKQLCKLLAKSFGSRVRHVLDLQCLLFK